MSKAEAVRLANATDRQRWVDRWFAASGTTMSNLTELIERLQPDVEDGGKRLGLHPRIALMVMHAEHPQLDNDTKLRIVRAIQHLAITRPYLAAQADLFQAAAGGAP